MMATMTSLLNPPSSFRLRPSADGRRPLVIGAMMAGAAAAGGVLVACMAVALTGWFAADEGTHGSTTDALHIGADVWLVAHRAGIDVGGASLTLTPLLLTVLCAHVCYRMGRWAGMTSEPGESLTLGVATLALAAAYALVAIVVAVLASAGGATPSPGAAFVGAFVLAFVGGGIGLAVGAGTSLPSFVTDDLRSIALAGVMGALLLFASGAALVAVRVGLHLDDAANVVVGLNTDGPGDAFVTLAAAGVVPNAIMCAVSYILGPGFAVGVGTSVTTGSATIGALPASPILVALPQPGPGPAWAPFLLAVPLVAGVLAGWWSTRAFPCSGYLAAVARAAVGGVVGGVLIGIACTLASGALGADRMAMIGPDGSDVGVAAALALGLGGAVGAVLRHWRRPVDS